MVSFSKIWPWRQSTPKAVCHKQKTSLIQPCQDEISFTCRYHHAPHRIEDDYDIEDHILGKGSNGNVVQAKRVGADSDHKFAVKCLKLRAIPEAVMEQLVSEAQLYLMMDHPHIARLHDVYESEDFLHLVMECLNGGELFDRVKEMGTIPESDVLEITTQILLVLNYVHRQGIVHRDIKMENFIFDEQGGTHLKLIDFGLSKLWDQNAAITGRCGTRSYRAPEVLLNKYTNKCDMWSLGVVVFVSLAGYMPFNGNVEENILSCRYTLKPEKWRSISKEATSFVEALMELKPEKRLSADQALEQPWISMSRRLTTCSSVDSSVGDALCEFSQASKFRRCCLEMVAWSLSNEDHAKVREDFLTIDANKQGTITFTELGKVLQDSCQMPEKVVSKVLRALSTDGRGEIRYSEFVAAMVRTKISLHDDLLRRTFRKFDAHQRGYITTENLRHVLGQNIDDGHVNKIMAEVGQLRPGGISYNEFASYLLGGDKAEQSLCIVNDSGVQTFLEQHLEESPTESSESVKVGVSGEVCHSNSQCCALQ